MKSLALVVFLLPSLAFSQTTVTTGTTVVTGTSAADPVVDPAAFRKMFSATRTAYNAKTGELSLTYDFKNAAQLKDFTGSAPVVKNGMLILEVSEKLQHTVRFDTATVTGAVSTKTPNHTKALLFSTTEQVQMLHGPAVNQGLPTLRLIGKNGVQSTVIVRWPVMNVPFSFKVDGKKVNTKVGDQMLDGECAAGLFGSLVLSGDGDAVGYTSMTIVGVPNKKWLSEFLAANATVKK